MRPRRARISLPRVDKLAGPSLHLDVQFINHAASQRVVHPIFDPMDQLEPPIEMLDESGAALDPIAVIAIEYAVHLANLGVMDVAADHTIDPTAGCLGGHGIGERADVL